MVCRTLLTTIAAVLLVAAGSASGCSSDSSDGNAAAGGAGGSVSDGAVDSSSGGSAGNDAAAGASGAAGSADAGPGAGDPCDVFMQDCVDPKAPKCTLDVTADPIAMDSTCEPSLGTQKDHEPCERPNDSPGVDTCDKGLWCSAINHVVATPQERECRKLCKASSECSTGEACVRLNDSDPSGNYPAGTRIVGACFDTCPDIFDQSNCVADHKCLSDFEPDLKTMVTICLPAGTAKVGESCKANDDCAGAAGCMLDPGPDHGTCQPWCDNSAHKTCAAGQTCLGFQNEAFGICATKADQ
jgi:hypothetical protein